MFTLSRVLPDSSLRPISAGMISRPEDTVACEILPGERAAVFLGADVMLSLGLDSESVLQFQTGGDVQVALLPAADPTLVFVFRDPGDPTTPLEFARIKHLTYEADDIRVFVQVFPVPYPREAVPAG